MTAKYLQQPRGLRCVCGLMMLASLILQVSGCATSADPVGLAPRSVTKRLGLPECRSTIPISPIMAVDLANKGLIPNPENDPQWFELLALRQPGDELRIVSCRVGDPYFFALIRSKAVIFMVPIPLVD